MVREICRDTIFLAQKAQNATIADLAVGQDLLDTLSAHEKECVGMAANMIGENLRIIVFDDNGTRRLMFNPVILKKAEPYRAEEGCLSLSGTRQVQRWKSISVQWQNEKFQTCIKTFKGWTAQIIQHEVDHCEGVLV